MTPFVGPSYTLALRKADVQRSVNLHLVGMESPGKAPFVLQSVPGYALFATGAGAARGCLKTNDRVFFVLGSGLYELNIAGTLTLKGTLATSTGPVSMAYGISQLVVVDGTNGYVLTLATDVFAQITDPDFYGSDTVTFFDNYFVFIRPDTGQFYISDQRRDRPRRTRLRHRREPAGQPGRLGGGATPPAAAGHRDNRNLVELGWR
jgi:hypothetical protein